MRRRAHVRQGQGGLITLAADTIAVREIYCSDGCGQDVALQHRIPPQEGPLEICAPTAKCGCGAELDHRVILLGETRRRRP